MLGPTFGDELAAASLALLPIAWGVDGVSSDRSLLTSEQNAALDAVIAAHNPAAVPFAVTRAAGVRAEPTRQEMLDKLAQVTNLEQCRDWVKTKIPATQTQQQQINGLIELSARILFMHALDARS